MGKLRDAWFAGVGRFVVGRAGASFEPAVTAAAHLVVAVIGVSVLGCDVRVDFVMASYLSVASWQVSGGAILPRIAAMAFRAALSNPFEIKDHLAVVIQFTI